jgi:hypothetical protein
MKIFPALLSICLFFAANAFAGAPEAPAEITLTYKNSLFSYITSADLTVANPAIETAFIVVHGSDLNVADYWRTINQAAQTSGNGASVITIAPHYKVVNEKGSGTILPQELIFTDEGWLRGDPAVNNAQVASFELIDQLVEMLANAAVYPNLKTIILTGHSAGGQLTQRYALGSQEEDHLALTHPGLHFRYIPVNPGSYAFLTPNRKFINADNSVSYGVPANPKCAYDDYKYGLENLNAYLALQTTDAIVTKYLQRDLTYLLGEADILTDPADIDDGCEALYQGKTRYERGTNFKAQLDFEFPENKHQFAAVPGVGHTEYGMYLSPVGMHVLFPSLPVIPSPTPALLTPTPINENH